MILPPIHIASRPPSDDAIVKIASHARGARLTSYPGSTRDGDASLPRGWWSVNRKRTAVGHGGETFTRAAAALDRVEHCFDHGWLTARVLDGGGDGSLLVVCARQLFFVWCTNINRLLRDVSQPRVRSVAWATTVRHVLAGEERIEVRWDEATDEVTFEVLSFSRPRHWLAWVTYPLVVLQQRRFAHDATAAVAERTAQSS